MIQQALDAITRVSKGFNSTLCTRTRPQLGEWLRIAFSVVAHTCASQQEFCCHNSVLDLHRPDMSTIHSCCPGGTELLSI